MRWFQALMPREDRFFGLFNRHAQTLVAGAQQLGSLLAGRGDRDQTAAQVFKHEEEADAITREVMILVQRTFITPFDRSDIKDLISTLDDTIDQMKKTAKAVVLFEVTKLEPEMASMGELINQAAALTVEAVHMLGAFRDNATKLHAIIEKIIHLEEDADVLNDKGIKALFLRHRNGNAMDYIVGIEIYDHLEKVMDRFEDVANRISSIVIEQV